MNSEIDWTSPPLSEPPVVGKMYLARDGEIITILGSQQCYRPDGSWMVNARSPLDLIREYSPRAPLKVWMNTHFEGPATLWQTKAEAQSYERIAGMCTRNAVPVTITEGH